MTSIEMQSVRLYCLSGLALVEGKAHLKEMARLGDEHDLGIAGDLPHTTRGDRSQLRGVPKRREKLAKHVLRGDDLGTVKLRADLHGPHVPLVPWIGKGNPVKRVGEDPSHVVGRLGVP